MYGEIMLLLTRMMSLADMLAELLCVIHKLVS